MTRLANTVPLTLIVAVPLSFPWLGPAESGAAFVMVTVPDLRPVDVVVKVALIGLRVLIVPVAVVVDASPVEPRFAFVALASLPLKLSVVLADWAEPCMTRPNA